MIEREKPMAENSKPQANAGQDPDDAPDLSRAPWREKLDVLERFRKTGPGWQSGSDRL